MMITTKHLGQEVTDGRRKGVLQSVWMGRAWVRPDGGGVEWDAQPSALVAVEEAEQSA